MNCADCGVETRLHRGVTGAWLGCDIARASTRTSEFPPYLGRWNDPRPEMTVKVRAAMCDGSLGPELEILMDGKSNDEQLTIAHAVWTKVIAIDRADLAQRGK